MTMLARWRGDGPGTCVAYALLCTLSLVVELSPLLGLVASLVGLPTLASSATPRPHARGADSSPLRGSTAMLKWVACFGGVEWCAKRRWHGLLALYRANIVLNRLPLYCRMAYRISLTASCFWGCPYLVKLIGYSLQDEFSVCCLVIRAMRT